MLGGMRKKVFIKSFIFLPLLITSCATITGGSVGMNREITILSDPSGADIYIDGVPRGTTPTKLQMSSVDLTKREIVLSKKGYKTTPSIAKEGLSGMFLGNVIFGGIGGAVVDGLSGNAIKTKKSILVKLQPES
jgi:hypothetical protein